MLAESLYRSLGLNFLSKINELGIYVSDAEGHILFWNRGATELFGWQEDDVLSKFGAKFASAESEWKDAFLFSRHDQANGACGRERADAVRTGLVMNERRYTRQDGSQFMGMSLLLPLHAELEREKPNDSPQYFLRIVRDITDQKKNVERLEQALDLQNHVTETMKSSQLPALSDNAFSGVRLAALYHPTHAEERVGGDFYDALRLSDGGIAVFVGDASGKGIRASSRATEVRYSLRAFLREDPDPARAVNRVNNILCQNLLLEQRAPFVSESMMFTTLTLAVIYPERRELHWVHAGGEFPLIFHMDGSPPTIAQETGHLMLGVSPEQNYVAAITPLTRGDVVLLYTDGITEARQSDRFFGTEGVLRAVEMFLSRKDPYAMNARRVAEEVLWQAVHFAEKNTDDMCVLTAQLMD